MGRPAFDSLPPGTPPLRCAQGARHADHSTSSSPRSAGPTAARSGYLSYKPRDLDTAIYIRSVVVKDGSSFTSRRGGRHGRRRGQPAYGVQRVGQQGPRPVFFCAVEAWRTEQPELGHDPSVLRHRQLLRLPFTYNLVQYLGGAWVGRVRRRFATTKADGGGAGFGLKARPPSSFPSTRALVHAEGGLGHLRRCGSERSRRAGTPCLGGVLPRASSRMVEAFGGKVRPRATRSHGKDGRTPRGEGTTAGSYLPGGCPIRWSRAATTSLIADPRPARPSSSYHLDLTGTW